MPEAEQPVLTLNQAADELGVHYMTAYRYVRHGRLPADKVDGVWRVRRSDLERFVAGSSAVSTEVVAAGSDRRRRRVRWADRLETRLLAGDEAGSWGVVESALAAGSDIRSIYLDVITPAMVALGARWERGEIDIAIEHRATAIVNRLIGRLGPRFVRRGRSRGTVVVGAPSGETHSLPVALLADLIRAEGFDVSDLGGDVPASSFAHAVRAADDVVAVAVSVTHRSHLGRVPEICAAVRAVAPGVMLVVGGPAVDGPDHAGELGADRFARSAADLAQALESG